MLTYYMIQELNNKHYEVYFGILCKIVTIFELVVA